MHIILSWLRLGDGSPVHGFQIFFSLTIKKQAFRCLQTLSSPPDGQSPSATPPTANEFRSVFQQSGAFGIQGRHWFDSNASHSAPSTRQDGAHNVNKQRKSL